MAAKTQLGPTATPGKRYSFSAKSVAADGWQNATLVGIDNASGKEVIIVGKILLS